MSVDSASTSKVVHLYLRPHQVNEDINYMRHTLKEWDIGKLKDPIYFYQPTVRPTSDGGIVKDTYSGPRKNKEFFEVRKEFIKRPDDELWMMYTSDGVLFKGHPDTLSSHAIIYPDKDKFEIQVANNSIRIKDGKDLDQNIDIETVLKRKKQEEDAKQRAFKNNFRFMYDAIERKEKQRLSHAKELFENGDEDIAIGGSGDSDGNDEDAYKADENEADVEVDRSDDDEDIPDDLDNLFTEPPEELINAQGSSDEEESQDSYDEDSEGEDGSKKKKKKKKGHNQQTPDQQETTHQNPDQADRQQSTEQIVDDIMGPKVVKEDELVRFMMDVGFVTLKQLWDKFKDRLQASDVVKDAFRRLIIKKLQQFTENGIKYVKLKK